MKQGDTAGLAQYERPPVYRIVVAQCLLSLLIAVTLLWVDLVTAYSSLLGGLCCVLPNAYFTRRAFMHFGTAEPRQVLRGFYVGGAVKIALTAWLFMVAFVAIKPLNVLALLLTYIAIQSVSWFAPLLLRQRQWF